MTFFFKAADDLLVQFEGTHSNGITRVNGSSDVNGELKTPQKNGKVQQDLQLSPLCQPEAVEDDAEVENVDGESSEGGKQISLFARIITTPPPPSPPPPYPEQ